MKPVKKFIKKVTVSKSLNLMSYILPPVFPKLTLQEWCGLNGINLEVNERGMMDRKKYKLARYYISPKYLEIIVGAVYHSPCGNGPTVKAAIKDLAYAVSQKTVRVGCKELDVPKLKLTMN